MASDAKYNISGGQIGAVGDNAAAHHFTQQTGLDGQQSLDLSALAEQLGKIIEAANSRATEPEHQLEIGALAAAKSAAENGDESKTLTFLKNTGKWTLGIATDISAKIAAELITKMISPI